MNITDKMNTIEQKAKRLASCTSLDYAQALDYLKDGHCFNDLAEYFADDLEYLTNSHINGQAYL